MYVILICRHKTAYCTTGYMIYNPKAKEVSHRTQIVGHVDVNCHVFTNSLFSVVYPEFLFVFFPHIVRVLGIFFHKNNNVW